MRAFLQSAAAPFTERRPEGATKLIGSFLSQERSSIGNNTPSNLPVKDSLPDFMSQRQRILSRHLAAHAEWNDSVAALVSYLGKKFNPYSIRRQGRVWQEEVAAALRSLKKPLYSDVILTTGSPQLKNDVLEGNVRAFCTTVLDRDLEFMPKTMEYPKFPYFQIEPATFNSLHEAGLYLLSNPPGVTEDEPDEEGSKLNMSAYAKTPMVSVELQLRALPENFDAAVLLNWSCRGRAGAKAKVFIDGEQDLPAFEVTSTTDDTVPNFWTVIPWRAGPMVIDLKHVGSGYLWFEHVDVHHVRWQAKS